MASTKPDLVDVHGRVPTAGSRLWLVAAGVALVAVNLRPPITAVSPVLGQIERDEGFNSTVASLLVAVPVACFVVFSAVSPVIGRRVGMLRAIGLALLVLLLGFGIRLVPSTPALFLGTTVIGLAITVVNVLLPAAIKHHHPGRIGLLTGLYTMFLYLGAAAAAGFTLPLQEATGLGWRSTLGLWSALVVVAVVVWLPQSRTRDVDAAANTGRPAANTVWRQPLAWAVAVFFAMPALLFYTVSAWLPTILIDAGMDAPRAGAMLSVANLAAVPSALAASLLAGHTKNQVWGTTLTGLLLAVAVGGLLVSGAGATILWMILLGIGLGAGTAIAYSLPLLRSHDGRTAAELNAMCQIAGYSLCAFGPVLAGALHDLTHTWTTVLVLLVGLALVQIAAGFSAGRDRFVQ